MINAELDRWLAEWMPNLEVSHPDVCILHVRIIGKNYCSDWFKWHPTIDIAQTMMCVQQMQIEGYSYMLEDTNPLSSIQGCPMAYFVKGMFPPSHYLKKSKTDKLYCVRASTPELAICKAIYEIKKD
jgi:hypothetical protein